jgi:hypothetical protein
MSQKELVRKRLESKGHITTVQAVDMFILRLGSIVNRLRNEGMKIQTTYPEGKRYAKYVSAK